jgi:hypothetical protein
MNLGTQQLLLLGKCTSLCCCALVLRLAVDVMIADLAVMLCRAAVCLW